MLIRSGHSGHQHLLIYPQLPQLTLLLCSPGCGPRTVLQSALLASFYPTSLFSMHIHVEPRKGFIPKYFPLQQRGTTMTGQTTSRAHPSSCLWTGDAAKTAGEDRKLWHCLDTTSGHWHRHSWEAAVAPREKLPDSS